MSCWRESQVAWLRRGCCRRSGTTMGAWRREKTPAGSNRWVGAGLAMGLQGIRARQMVGLVLANARHEASLVFLVHALRLCVHKPIHGVVRMVTVSVLIIWCKASHASPPAGASTLSLVVSRERIAASKPSSALGADMWSFAGMELSVSFQVVESAETRLAGLADKRLLLTVSE